MAKITVQTYDTTTTWEVPNSDVTAEELIQGFVGCLVGQTFYQEQIANAMLELGKEYLEDVEIPELGNSVQGNS